MPPWIVPAAVEDAVRRAAESVLGAARVTGPALTRAVIDRSRRYTSERDRLSIALDPDGDLAARACFFTVADCAKIRVPLAELAAAGALPAADPLRVVDLGAGCGAMAIGLVAQLPDRAIELVLIDHDARALAIATRAIGELAPAARVKVRAVTTDVTTAVVPRCDLVLMGTVLNELPAEAARGVLERAVAAIRDDGAVIAIEPALKETTRALHALRDPLIAGGAHVFAPCGHDRVPCPMLEGDRDWCHEDRGVELPPRTRQLAAVTGLRDAGLKFSYLTLRRAAGGIAAGADRVVEPPRAQKGKLELVRCTPGGLVPTRLLTRHKSDANRPLLRADRGDLVRLTPVPETLDVTRDTVVELIEPSRP